MVRSATASAASIEAYFHLNSIFGRAERQRYGANIGFAPNACFGFCFGDIADPVKYGAYKSAMRERHAGNQNNMRHRDGNKWFLAEMAEV